MTTFFKNSEIPIEKVKEGMSRQIMGYQSNLMVVKVCFENGVTADLHKHPHQQVAYIDEGKFDVEVGGAKVILEKGDSFVVPSQVLHGVVCLEKGIIIDTFSPKRADFLKQELQA
jgi:quercetin dioxygenase-like cupin family protein